MKVGTLEVEIKLKPKFSFWDAIKIRIAGIKSLLELNKKEEK